MYLIAFLTSQWQWTDLLTQTVGCLLPAQRVATTAVPVRTKRFFSGNSSVSFALKWNQFRCDSSSSFACVIISFWLSSSMLCCRNRAFLSLFTNLIQITFAKLRLWYASSRAVLNSPVPIQTLHLSQVGPGQHLADHSSPRPRSKCRRT